MNIYYDDIDKLVLEGLDEDLVLYFQGKEYYVNPENNEMMISPLDLDEKVYVDDEYGRKHLVIPRFITKTESFDEDYSPIDAELGAIVSEDSTTFNLWAPTAHKVSLILEGTYYPMTREKKGIYSVSFDENLHARSYLYEVEVGGSIHRTEDPYGKASLPNRKASVVVDSRKISKKLKSLNKPLESIMEVHARDFSMDPYVPFKYPGKLRSLIESHGQFGMQHIINSGVSHVQLLPVMDFVTVDENDPFRKYNWGYDTMQYFSLENSYSSNIDDPLQIINDFQDVIEEYHKNDIGLIMDVVFNHVYDVESSSFNKTVPYYYFRYDDNGKLLNGSFCGNEFATERPMVRKLIVDACAYFHHEFGIDGFRFDLMGLMDIDTIKEIETTCPDVHLYGEGWNMEAGIDRDYRANMRNYTDMENVGFFNDEFRDFLAGDLHTSKGAWVYHEEFEDVLLEIMKGSRHKFLNPHQSINYLECHDNLTLADRFKKEEVLFLNKILALSDGVTFFQIGQSFYRDKQGDRNSYRSSDAINRIEWGLLEDNQSMNDEFFEFLKLKRDYGTIKNIEKEAGIVKVQINDHKIVINRHNKTIKLN